MLLEVESAADFLSSLIRTRCNNSNKVELFREHVQDVLRSHYDNHWFPEKPFKGSGYRCIRIVNNKMDPLIAKAGVKSGLSLHELLSLLPNELTMWIDPEEVSYRIGEEGSIGLVFGGASSDESSSSSSDSEVSSQGSPSPTQDILGCKNGYMSYYHPSNTMNYVQTPQYVAS